MKKILCVFLAVMILSITLLFAFGGKTPNKGSYIKYVEFNVTQSALQSAIELDKQAHEDGKELSFVTILSYLGAKYGGDFKKYKFSDMSEFVNSLNDGQSLDKLTNDMPYFKYYSEAYGAVLNGMVGEYEEENSEKTLNSHYGVRWFSPIAKTFPYSSYDDFGAVRTYGYTRPHLGHDMMSAVGTPVIAVESGTVECLGWNQYGGWRVGIRSNDKKRYWYYAHLRQNRPFAESLKEGNSVKAGDVIGYVGRTGYSVSENINGITESHLHIGLELVFDERQKESDNEIWVDITAITNVLECHKSSVVRNNQTKEFTRQFDFNEK